MIQSCGDNVVQGPSKLRMERYVVLSLHQIAGWWNQPCDRPYVGLSSPGCSLQHILQNEKGASVSAELLNDSRW